MFNIKKHNKWTFTRATDAYNGKECYVNCNGVMSPAIIVDIINNGVILVYFEGHIVPEESVWM